MPPIDLIEVGRLARKRFGSRAPRLDVSFGAALAAGNSEALAASLCLAMRRLGPPPEREVPTVVVRDVASALDVPGWLPQLDPVQEHYKSLEETRPDLFN